MNHLTTYEHQVSSFQHQVSSILGLESCILCLESSTFVVSALQIAHFMQNKPNFRKAQMNVNMVLTRDYAKKTPGERGKNKPNSNPIQTQSNPIKANKMPKQTQYKPKTNPIKPNFPKSQQSHFSMLLICVKNSDDFGSDIVRRPCFTRYTSRRMHKKIYADTINFPTAIQRFSADFVQITLVLTEIVRLQNRNSGQKPTYLVKSYKE